MSKKHLIPKQLLLKHTNKIIILGLAALVLALSILAFIFNNQYVVVNFSEQSDCDYKIYTVDNKYYNKILDKDQQYITSIIDRIDLNPTYIFKTDQNLDFTYTYKAVGNLIVYDRSNDKNVLFSKEYEILPETTKQSNNSKEFSIDEILNINYHDYDNYSKQYMQDFNITGDDNFIVTLTIDAKCKLPDAQKVVSRSFQMDFTIPMTEKTINISTDTKSDKTVNCFTFENNNIKKFPIFGSVAFGSLGLALLALGFVINVEKYKNMSEYSKWLRKLQNEHGNYIINISEKFNEENYEISYVLNFKDLLYKARLTNKNISCFEDKQNGITEFSIIEDGVIYKKVYKESDKYFS